MKKKNLCLGLVSELVTLLLVFSISCFFFPQQPFFFLTFSPFFSAFSNSVVRGVRAVVRAVAVVASVVVVDSAAVVDSVDALRSKMIVT